MQLEDKTFDIILDRMLSKVPDGIDKREGSVIYDALAPAAAELAQVYIELYSAKNSLSPDTSTGDELTEYAYERGVFRKGATKSIRKGIFNTNIPLNSRFSAQNNTFKAIEHISNFEYKLECEQAGEEGNIYTGPLSPIDYIEGLNSAELTDVLVPGVNEESDEQLRNRLRQNFIDPAQDGNIAQYKQWAGDYEGIGAAKVFPLWNGGNTVKVAITNRLFQVADSTLVNEFQEYLDPGSQGLGNGKAPLGSKVTVTGGVRKDINITGNVILADGFTEPDGVSEAISEYLASVTYVKNSVSYMRVAVAILDLPSIVDLNNFTVNGGTADIELIGEEIPTLNSINLTAV
jgi:uncharacterized phage protein gp47/JayE